MSAIKSIKATQPRIQKWTPSIKTEDSSPSTTVDETQTKSDSSSSASEGSPGEDRMERTARRKKIVADEIIGAPVRYEYSIIPQSKGEIEAEKRLAQMRADTGLGTNIPRLSFHHTIMKVIIDKWDIAKLNYEQPQELVKTSMIYTVGTTTMSVNSCVPDCTSPDQVAEIVSEAQMEAKAQGVRMT